MTEALDLLVEPLTRGNPMLPLRWACIEDFIDDDGVDYGKPIRLFVTIRKSGNGMVVDWTGTSPQVKGAINNTLSFTKAASYCAVRSVLPQTIPSNEGVFRAIDVICPPGTVGNGVLPAACAARGLTGFRMVDCMFGALAMMLPDRVPAAGDGGNTGISIGGYDDHRKPFVYVDFTCGAWGGSPWGDGLNGNSHMMANMASQSIEVTEAEMPLAVTAYEFVTDKAGAGKFRGGVPFGRDYRFLEHEGTLQVRSDRRDHRPFGLYGGSPGRPSENYLNPVSDSQLLPSKFTMTIRRGDVFRHVLAGGGGWGDPLERDPQAVLRDVRNEYLSAERARVDYGVIIDTKAWRVCAAATEKLRVEIRTRAWLARGAQGAVARPVRPAFNLCASWKSPSQAVISPASNWGRLPMARKAKRRGRPPGIEEQEEQLAKLGESVAKMDVGQLRDYIAGLQDTLAAKVQQQREYLESQLAGLQVYAAATRPVPLSGPSCRSRGPASAAAEAEVSEQEAQAFEVVRSRADAGLDA